MTSTESSHAGHAFTAAVAAGNIDALIDTLSPDVVLQSPITSTPFEGREVVADLYRSLFEALEDVRITDELERGDTYVFFWEARLEGRFVAGADRMRTGPGGKVRHVTVMGRPLTGVAGFLSAAGYHFARRRRGPLVARILRMASLPLAPMFSLVDALVAWLIRGREPDSEP